MQYRSALVGAVLVVSLAGWAHGQASTFVETFESESNVGEWEWLGIGTPAIPAPGGNPGAYVTKLLQRSAASNLKHFAVDSPFVGDYREKRVASIGVDMTTWVTQENLEHPDFHMTLALANDNGTPFNLFDDSLYYLETALRPPQVGQGWVSYDFPVPSQTVGTPRGWTFYDSPFLPPLANPMTWDQVIQDVDYLWILNGDPLGIYIISNWRVGADNVRITFAGDPVAYCTAGISSSGCQASISATGIASASAASGFTVSAAGAEGGKGGLFFFGANGRQANPWGNGTSFQCVTPPVRRAGPLFGSGAAGQCDGSFSQDLNARWAAVPAQNPGTGIVVQVQLWHRDPANTSNRTTTLSNALEFEVHP